ncbi:MAG TPA: hypothetical protein VJU84_05150 [Pyrinomonadaceae bacterium]|nr:hypothetical protein [Pyrinomonadaceae bacterium]
MKRVLIVGSDFAPSSLPPATRIRFFASHLADFGWEPIVLSTRPQFYDWPTDAENECLLPESLKVVRTGAWSPRWTRKIGFGDVGMRSLWKHWKAIKQICGEQKIDLLFIPVPPYVPMVLGRMAHKKFGIPYVIDYIDPWVSEYYWQVPRDQRPPKWPLAYAMSRIVEPVALRKVAHITGVSKGTTDGVVVRYPWLSSDNASEIPYGAEPGDFQYIRKHPRSNSIFKRGGALIHLSYIGACIPGMYPAVRALFQAVALGLQREPELFNRLRFHFVGTSYSSKPEKNEGVEAIADEEGISHLVNETRQRVAYLDSLQLMLDSDALLLIGSDEAHYTASKVFPYLLSKRPLIIIFHEKSSVNEILRGATAAHSITFSSAEKVTDKVEQIYDAVKAALSADQVNGEANLEIYTTRSMAGRLAESFDRAVSAPTQPEKSVTGKRMPLTPTGSATP